jgi:hypothetical protein
MSDSLQSHRITSYIRFNMKTHIPHKHLSSVVCKGKQRRTSKSCQEYLSLIYALLQTWSYVFILLAIYAYRALIYDDLFTNTSVHLVNNICISFQIVFLSFHVRMFRWKQHIVYTSQHITRTVSTTVYGVYVFWLQGIIRDI